MSDGGGGSTITIIITNIINSIPIFIFIITCIKSIIITLSVIYSIITIIITLAQKMRDLEEWLARSSSSLLSS